MPINASYEFLNAEKKYGQAQTVEEKIAALGEMIKTAPKHKGSENLLSELRTRLKKLLEKVEKAKKVGKGQKGIRKEGFQVALVGNANSGKSALLGALTNAKPVISENKFSTKEPFLGTMDFSGVRAQIVDLPASDGRNFDFNIANTADCLVFVACNVSEFSELAQKFPRARGKRIFVFTKIDALTKDELRKSEASLKSKRLNFVMVSADSGDGIDELKKKIFDTMDSIRVFMKEPGKPAGKVPMVLPVGSRVRDIAESIYKGFSARVRETRVTGPSAKFMNQKVGLQHGLKDMDVVEFHTS